MFRRDARKTNRNQQGGSLVEMLVCSTIVALVAAGSLALIVSQNKVSQRFGNKMNAINAERIVLERIGKDIREARSIGDVFGEWKTYDVNGMTVTVVEGADYFPSSADPLYSNGAPPNGWPTSTNWAKDSGVPSPGRWRLSNTTLIAQIPIFDAIGFPTMIPANAYGAGKPSTASANVETHVYRLVPMDQSTNPGEYQLEYLQIPGMAVAGYVPANQHKGPQVIMKNIIGPKNVNGLPVIFQYLDRTGNGVPENTISNPQAVANYTGVVCNLEVRKHDAGAAHDAVLGFKTEVFLRNNALATETAAPSP